MKKGAKLEKFTALGLIGWGVWVLFLNSFETTRVFLFMKELAPYWLWGSGMLAIGTTKLVYAHLKHCKARLVLECVATFCYIVIFLMFIAGNVHSTAVPTYFVLILISWTAYTEILDGCRQQ